DHGLEEVLVGRLDDDRPGFGHLLLHLHPRVISLTSNRLAARAASHTSGSGPRVRPRPPGASGRHSLRPPRPIAAPARRVRPACPWAPRPASSSSGASAGPRCGGTARPTPPRAR